MFRRLLTIVCLCSALACGGLSVASAASADPQDAHASIDHADQAAPADQASPVQDVTAQPASTPTHPAAAAPAAGAPTGAHIAQEAAKLLAPIIVPLIRSEVERRTGANLPNDSLLLSFAAIFFAWLSASPGAWFSGLFGRKTAPS